MGSLSSACRKPLYATYHLCKFLDPTLIITILLLHESSNVLKILIATGCEHAKTSDFRVDIESPLPSGTCRDITSMDMQQNTPYSEFPLSPEIVQNVVSFPVAEA